MLDILQITIVAMLPFCGFFYFVCLNELKYFPTINLTEGGDITLANQLRSVVIIGTGLVSSYSLMTLGHYFGLGGFETLNKPNIALLFVILGIFSFVLFLISRFMDKTIYQSIAKYEGYLDLEYKEYRKKIRDADILRKKSRNKAGEMSEINDRLEEDLKKSTTEQYELDGKIFATESEMQERQESLGRLKKQKSDSEKKIKDTKKQLVADDISIKKVSFEVDELQKQVDKVEAAFREKQNILQPLLETQKDKSSTLKEKNREYKFLVKLIADTEKDISVSTKELTSLKRKITAELKSNSKLYQNSAKVQENLTHKLAVLAELEQQIDNHQSIIDEYNIVELSAEDREKTLELLEKRLNKHFSESGSSGNKIFEN